MSESRFSEPGSTFQTREVAGQGQRGAETTGTAQGNSGYAGSGGNRASGGSNMNSGSTGSSGNSGNGGANAGASEPADLSSIGHEAVSQAQEQAVKIVSQAREQVTASVKTQTTRGANIATVLSSTLKDAGSQLREQDEPAVATYLDQAAGQVEQIGSMLDNQDYGQLIGTVQGFARRQPVLFFAAAVAVGVVGARFLRSAAPQGASQQQRGPDAYAGLRNLQGGSERRAGGYA